MKNIKKWECFFALFLVLVSALLYYVLDLYLKDGIRVYESFLSQVAFLPIYVLIVTLVIEQLLNRKEKQSMALKLNVVIGLFFYEIGKDLIKAFIGYDSEFDNIRNEFCIIEDDFDDKYKHRLRILKKYVPDVEVSMQCIVLLKKFLEEKKNILEQLIQNPNLLEHDSFTEMILALFHLFQELSIRSDLMNISEGDCKHLKLDIERAYIRLLKEWLIYMNHLRKDYPYIFSVELRTNPFKI